MYEVALERIRQLNIEVNTLGAILRSYLPVIEKETRKIAGDFLAQEAVLHRPAPPQPPPQPPGIPARHHPQRLPPVATKPGALILHHQRCGMAAHVGINLVGKPVHRATMEMKGD